MPFLCGSKAHDSSEPPFSIVKEQPSRPLSWRKKAENPQFIFFIFFFTNSIVLIF